MELSLRRLQLASAQFQDVLRQTASLLKKRRYSDNLRNNDPFLVELGRTP